MEEELAILPLRGTVIYPQTVTPLAVAQPDAVRLLDGDDGAPRRVVAVALRGAGQGPGGLRREDCFDIGCLALVHRLLRLPDGSLRVAVEGLERCELLALLPGGPHPVARVRPLREPPAEAGPLAAELGRLRSYVAAMAGQPPGVSPELLAEIDAEEDPRRLSYLLAIPLLGRAGLAQRQGLLDLGAAAERLALLSQLVAERPLPEPEPPEPEPPEPGPAGELGRAIWLRQTAAGVAPAWVEAARAPGVGGLVRTGQAGAAARDAALIARSWLLAYADRHGLPPLGDDLHLHIPPGAAHDDLAGAGGPMAVALLSLLHDRPARADAALVGELGLRGRLLPLGRLRERMAAARAAGILTLALAAGHAEELAALPASLRAGLRIILAETIDETIDALLV